VHHLDFLDIVAILLGISFTIAKLDAQGRKAESFAHVPVADFERWRNWTVSIYRLGSGMCFLRVLFHQGWALYLGRQTLAPVPGLNPAAVPPALMYPAMAMDAVFLGVLASTFIRGARARTLRRELGIVLSPLTPQQAAALASNNEGEPEAKTDD
jgi:hypothetical protein